MSRRYPARFLLMLSYFASSACTLGPTTEVRTVIVNPGHPILILQNVKVQGHMLDTGENVSQDIGGWVCMPQSHFDALKRAAEKGQTP